jgi:hypothetical protein
MIKLPLKRLQLALRTGSVKTQKERAEERETLRRDLAMLRTPAVEESRRIVFRSEELQKSDPDSYLKSVESHCDMLLELGTRMEYTEHLQLGYWVDRLTIILVKLNRWKDAEARLMAFFALPNRYRKRSSASQLNSMRRRLERCRKALGE